MRSVGKDFVKHGRTNPWVVIVDDVEREPGGGSVLKLHRQNHGERTCLDMISFAIDTGGGV